MNLHKVPTTREVWAVIHASHRDLSVHGTLSNPEGDPYGNPNDCRMLTQYGLPGSDVPLLEADTRWTKDARRETEQTDFYLFYVTEDDT